MGKPYGSGSIHILVKWMLFTVWTTTNKWAMIPELLERFELWSVAAEIIKLCPLQRVNRLNLVRKLPYLHVHRVDLVLHLIDFNAYLY